MPTVMTYNSLVTDVQSYIERGFTSASDPLVYDQIPRLINNAEREIAAELKVQGFIQNLVGTFAVGTAVYDKPDRWREWISINYGTNRMMYNTVQRQAAAGVRTLTLDRPHNFSVGDPIIVSGMGASSYDTVGSVAVTAVTQLGVTYVQGATTEGATADTGGLVSGPMNKRVQLKPRAYEYIRAYWPDDSEQGDPEFYGDYEYYHFIVAPTPRRPASFEMNFYQLPQLLDSTNQTNWLTDLAPSLLLHKTLILAAPFLKNDERLQVWQTLYAQFAQALTGQDLDKIMDRTSDRSKP